MTAPSEPALPPQDSDTFHRARIAQRAIYQSDHLSASAAPRAALRHAFPAAPRRFAVLTFYQLLPASTRRDFCKRNRKRTVCDGPESDGTSEDAPCGKFKQNGTFRYWLAANRTAEITFEDRWGHRAPSSSSR